MYAPLVKELAHKAAAEAARIASSRAKPDEDAAEKFVETYDRIFEHIKKKLEDG